MRNSHSSTPSSDSGPFLVIKVSKRAALFLALGLAALAAAIAVRLTPSNIPAPPETVTSTAVVAPPPPSASGAKSAEPLPDRPATPASNRVPAADTTSVSEPASPGEPPSPPPPTEPRPVAMVTRNIAAYDPANPQDSSAQSGSPAPDSPPAEQPVDPAPAPAAAPDPPPPSYSRTVPAIVASAGSASPYALYSKWFESFQKTYPDVQFSYQPIGSQAAVRQLLDGLVNFGAVDAPLTNEQLALARVPILHVPSVIGAVVPVYELPGVTDLRFTPQILAGIFAGKITRWNDPLIIAHNPGANLTAWPILVVHRTDGCSTTQVFTDYLSKVSSDWQQRVGEGSSVKWPTGVGAKGNEGVYRLLKESFGAISYVDFQFAIENHMDFAGVQNHSGHFIKADLHSLTAAAASSSIPDDFRVWITNAPGPDAYPIATLLWFVAPAAHQSDPVTRDVAAFLRWMIQNNPQMMAAKLSFAPLPKELTDRLNDAISKMR